MKNLKKILGLLLISILASCSQTTTEEEVFFEGGDSIVGQWFLVAIGDTDVSAIECYSDSYLAANSSEIDFFIQDRQEDGSCVTVLSDTTAYTQQEGFYYIGDEAIEIYIDGRTLTWRIDSSTTLIFEKS